MSRSLVTGGAGFIGSHLVRYLLEEGHQVVVIDNLSTGKRSNLADVEASIHFIQGDVRDRELVHRELQGIDYVFHEAALPSVARSVQDPWESNDHNINGTLSLLIAAASAGVKRFVYAASSSAYGDTKSLPKHEGMPARPLSPYAISKYAGELYSEAFFNLYGLETVALRYFNVFGPRQNPDSEYAAVIPKFAAALLKGEPPVIYGDGTQTRDFTYIDNVVRANLLAAEAPANRVVGRVFNIACGQETSLLDLLARLRALLVSDIEPRFAPRREGDVYRSCADIAKASAAFNYRPVIGLSEGLERTVAWMQRQQ
ncbi:MAG: SDR family oxidoreductase [Bacillota bacterium]